MSELSTLARPYAAAVFKRANESDSAEKWSQMLVFIAAVVKDNDITTVINNPKVSKDRLCQLMLDICQDQLNSEGENLLKLLVQNDRLLLAPQISSLYEAHKAEAEGYVDVDVKTAYAFTKEEQKKFTSALEKTLAKKVRINVTVDKALIGGFLAKAGDRVIDGSIKGQLQQLAKRLVGCNL
jgi:F-type H+-transporting ATPase subunit delta